MLPPVLGPWVELNVSVAGVTAAKPGVAMLSRAPAMPKAVRSREVRARAVVCIAELSSGSPLNDLRGVM